MNEVLEDSRAPAVGLVRTGSNLIVLAAGPSIFVSLCTVRSSGTVCGGSVCVSLPPSIHTREGRERELSLLLCSLWGGSDRFVGFNGKYRGCGETASAGVNLQYNRSGGCVEAGGWCSGRSRL